jgi:hypothetical protein
MFAHVGLGLLINFVLDQGHTVPKSLQHAIAILEHVIWGNLLSSSPDRVQKLTATNKLRHISYAHHFTKHL